MVYRPQSSYPYSINSSGDIHVAAWTKQSGSQTMRAFGARGRTSSAVIRLPSTCVTTALDPVRSDGKETRRSSAVSSSCATFQREIAWRTVRAIARGHVPASFKPMSEKGAQGRWRCQRDRPTEAARYPVGACRHHGRLLAISYDARQRCGRDKCAKLFYEIERWEGPYCALLASCDVHIVLAHRMESGKL